MGQVHTLSKYVPSAPNIGVKDNFKEKKLMTINKYIQILQGKELKFYRQFFPDCVNFADFQTKLNNILSSISDQDRAIIKNFTSDKISTWLHSAYDSNKKTTLTNNNFSTITIKLKQDETRTQQQIADELNEALQQLKNVGSESIVVTGVSLEKDKIKSIDIKFGLRTDILKIILNTVSKHHFNTTSESLDYFKRVLLNSEEIVSLESSNEQFLFKAGSKITGSPFNYDKKQIEKMKQSEQDALEQDIKNALIAHLNLGSGSDEIKAAFNLVWNRQISMKNKNPYFNHFGIAGLTYGGSVSNIIGAMGEIQTALLGYYLQMKCKKTTTVTNEFLSLISDPFISGEQLKADVIIAGAGIQVKNYSESEAHSAGSRQKLNVNVHFDRLAGFGGDLGFDIKSFEEYLVNVFFNQSTSFGGYWRLMEALKFCFAELASMDLTQENPDKVLFYFLGGAYFLPASEMLNMLYVENKIEVDNVSITSAYTGLSDEGYAKTEPKFYPDYGGKGRTKQRPKFVDFYAGNSLTYTSLGKDTYDEIKNGISFRASILYSSLLNSNFKIF